MVLYGKAVSSGIAIGEAYVYKPVEPHPKRRDIDQTEVAEEQGKYEAAIQSVSEGLTGLIRATDSQQSDKLEIFQAHAMILADTDIQDEVKEAISEKLFSAEWAVYSVYTAYASKLKALDDPVFRERAADLTDVSRRILRCINGLPAYELANFPDQAIIFADDLMPSDTAQFDSGKIAAIVTAHGNARSHTAILAKMNGIPAVLGVGHLIDNVDMGMSVIVDAVKGRVLLSPSEEERRLYMHRRNKHLREKQEADKYFDLPGKTADGVDIEFMLNIIKGVNKKMLNHVRHMDGIGLFRTEFIYMDALRAPSEDEQYEIYKEVLSACKDKTVIIRTFDIGGDKTLEYLELPKEENPFLGLRGIRLSLNAKNLFETQLRALLRASVHGNLWIMFPMVDSLTQYRQAKALMEECKSKLKMNGRAVADNIMTGIMIEVPSIALIADIAAKEVDFASIGTNDLCQYVTAADRMNEFVADSYQPLHPGLLRLIASTVKAFDSAGKPICVCGEMGGDLIGAALLVGLGMRRLSMNISCVPNVKRLLSKFTIGQLEELSEACQKCSTAADAEAYCMEKLGAIIGEDEANNDDVR